MNSSYGTIPCENCQTAIQITSRRELGGTRRRRRYCSNTCRFAKAPTNRTSTPRIVADRESGSKQCSVCHEDKNLSEFYYSVSKTKGERYDAGCKDCRRQRANERILERFGARRWKHLHDNYGMTKARWDEMYAEQLGLCAICRQREAVVVDHCHHTSIVRGLLCNPCNMMLGIFEADPTIMERFARYLKRHRGAFIHVVTGG